MYKDIIRESPLNDYMRFEDGIFRKDDSKYIWEMAMILLNDNVFQNIEGINLWWKYNESSWFGKSELSE